MLHLCGANAKRVTPYRGSWRVAAIPAGRYVPSWACVLRDVDSGTGEQEIGRVRRSVDLDHDLDEDVLICGDRREDKAQVAELVDLIPGLRPVDCGPLEMARIVEQLTPLIISINVRNKVRAGIKITGL